MTSSAEPTRRTAFVQLLLFVVLVLGGGVLIGFATAPGEWYATLEKPWFSPPEWVFAPVWSVLYLLIAVAGWRTWRRRSGGPAMRLWLAQLLLNFAWTPVFFGLHAMAAALALILVLLAATLGFVAVTWRSDRAAALMFLPYAAWVAFATALNAALLTLN